MSTSDSGPAVPLACDPISIPATTPSRLSTSTSFSKAASSIAGTRDFSLITTIAHMVPDRPDLVQRSHTRGRDAEGRECISIRSDPAPGSQISCRLKGREAPAGGKGRCRLLGLPRWERNAVGPHLVTELDSQAQLCLELHQAKAVGRYSASSRIGKLRARGRRPSRRSM